MLRGVTALYTFIFTQAVSMVGSQITVMGLGLWLFERTQTITPLLLVAFFKELPGMLLGSLAGVWVDRVSRKSVLVLTDTGLALGTLVLLISILTDTFTIPLLYGVALLTGVLNILQSAAKDASLSLMIPDSQRDRINGLQQMVFPFAGVVAPALTGLVYATGGIAAIFAVDLTTFVIGAGGVLRMEIPQPAASEEHEAGESWWQDLWVGLRFLGAQTGLLILLLHAPLINYLLNGSLEITLPYVVTITGSEVATGLVLMAMSLGAFTGGAMIAARATIQRRVRLMVLGMLLTAVMYVVYGLVRSPWLLAGSLFLLMIPLPMGNALLNGVLQTRVPGHLQGRIFAFHAQLSFVGSTLAFLTIGPLVDRVLEPGVQQGWWAVVAPLVGRSAGSGMALLLIATGVVIGASTVVLWLIPAVRGVDG